MLNVCFFLKKDWITGTQLRVLATFGHKCSKGTRKRDVISHVIFSALDLYQTKILLLLCNQLTVCFQVSPVLCYVAK